MWPRKPTCSSIWYAEETAVHPDRPVHACTIVEKTFLQMRPNFNAGHVHDLLPAADHGSTYIRVHPFKTRLPPGLPLL